MNFLGSNDSPDESLEINITPLVDVVFLLLIFFMVSTTFDQTRGIKVSLPTASNASEKSDRQEIRLSISKDGELQLDDRPVRLADLKGKLETILQGRSEKSIVLNADKAASHGLVVEAMDKAKDAGIDKIAIAAQVN